MNMVGKVVNNKYYGKSRSTQIVEKLNTNYEFKPTSSEFKSTSYKFKSTSYKVQL